MVYKVVGNTAVEWNDDEPFIFTMSEEVGPKNDHRKKPLSLIYPPSDRALKTLSFCVSKNI